MKVLVGTASRRDGCRVRAGEALGATVELVDDGRGAVLRVRWHEDEGVVVVSTWRDDHCVATVRLDGADCARVSALLGRVVATAPV